jgi:hypothetical protein
MALRFKPEAIVAGVCLVVLGVMWTLANLGRLELLATLRTWWPTSLVLWGALELVNTYSARGDAGRGQ